MNSNPIKLLWSAGRCVLPKKSGRFFLASLLLANTLALVGCGSGSASTAATENSLPSPVAKAIDGSVLVPDAKGQEPVPPSGLELLPQISLNQRQLADPNVLLNLTASVTAASGSTIVKTLWTQVTGPKVSIPSPLQLNNVVLLPDVNIATQLEFRLTAQDDQGRINSATLVVLVKPVPTFIKVVGGVFNEADKKAVFTLSLNAPSSSPVTLSYITLDGTAESGTDYSFTAGDVVLAAGQLSTQITVPLFDDTLVEDDETFALQVMAINGEATHANRGTAIIHNGQEPELQQTIQFSNQGPVSIYIDQQYSNTLSLPGAQGTGDILYSSSNPLVATVNAQGLIVPLALGTTEITATKLADANYLPASATFALHILSRGSAPVVQMEEQDGFSVQVGDNVEIQGVAGDQEDGALPTVQQINDHLASGQPITSVHWESDLDGVFWTGSTFNTKYLRQGTHRLTYSVTDSDDNTRSASIKVFVGNVAVLGYAYASTLQCVNDTIGGGCSYPSNLNDMDLTSDIIIKYFPDSENTESAAWMLLNWEVPMTVNTVDVYMHKDYVIQDYDIGYFNANNQWTLLQSVTGNTEAYRSHAIPVTTVPRLGILVKKGSLATDGLMQINEIVVFGTFASSASSASNVPEPGPSSAKSSVSSSSSAPSTSGSKSSISSASVASSKSASSTASSSVIKSSSIASSLKSSSAASSVKSSSVASSLKSSSSLPKSSSSSSKPTIIIKSSSSEGFILL